MNQTVTGVVAVAIEFKVSPPGPPLTYLGVADGLMPGIRILGDASPVPALSLTLLCAHALECILKAYLSRSGDDSCVLEPRVRHNLNTLWSMARDAGLDLPADPPQWVSLLGNLHGHPYYLRYSNGINCLVLPPQAQMVAGLSELLSMVRNKL